MKSFLKIEFGRAGLVGFDRIEIRRNGFGRVGFGKENLVNDVGVNELG